jgi:hypothetical protein
MPSTGITNSKFQVRADYFTITLFLLSEPIGSTKPKFASSMESMTIKRTLSSRIALTCPAQGTPIPSFRLEHYLKFILIVRAYRINKAKILK